jgi:phospholipid transport system transporter-binding protein
MQLPATATLSDTSTLLRGVEAALAEGTGALRIDASALRHFDTSALALLLHARRLAEAAGRGFEIEGPPDKLAQLARLYGVAALLGLPSAS